MRLPLIVGFGGINAAGRSSFHHGYRRLVIDALPRQEAERCYRNLAALMKLEVGDAGLSDDQRAYIREHTLIRRIEAQHFDPERVPVNKRLPIASGPDNTISLVTRGHFLPDPLPPHWQVVDTDGRNVRVAIEGTAEFLLPSEERCAVQAAGQLPTGFEPGKLYPSRNHPRGLQMAVFAASDALGSMGIDWSEVCRKVAPDEISVYAGSAMGQLDDSGTGGMLASRFRGKRITSKHCPLGFVEMPADFVNAYVLGSLGNTGAGIGACATFLYNLRQGIADIQAGRTRVAVIGSSEAPILPEVIEGYIAMGALATDPELMALDGSESADHRRACRPFGNNCGFTIAEGAQFLVLFDDELALEMGATVYGAVGDVFVNADGHKKSISAPGVGNFLTVAKALAAARSILGEDSIRHRSLVQAHGTGTPQNRVTESEIFDAVAQRFGIRDWPLTAIKAYIGHTLGTAAGDQIAASLGIWAHGWVPGIRTIDRIADDVHAERLDVLLQHRQLDPAELDTVIVNAKGFGGNNATAALLAPHVAMRLLGARHGKQALQQYRERNESVAARAAAYDELATSGRDEPVYRYDHGVLAGDDLALSDHVIDVPGYGLPVDLDLRSPYADWLEDND